MSEGRIYTKLGDDGSTGLLFGGRISKASLLMATIGSIDETVATLGIARAACDDPALRARILGVQRELFVVGADLVANPRARERLEPAVSLVTPSMVSRLESLIDQCMAAYPLKPVFIVPGVNTVSATLDLARAQVRKTERHFVAWNDSFTDAEQELRPNRQVGIYLNRVSDLLYMLARQAADGADEPASHD